MDKGLEFLGNIVQCFGVQMRTYMEPLMDLEGYDGGFRSRLSQKHDTGYLAEFLRSTDCFVLYMTENTYTCHYCFWKYDGGGAVNYCVIGPWIEDLPTSADIDELLQKNLFRTTLDLRLNSILIICRLFNFVYAGKQCW
jgi:hypothetical protein